MTKAMHRIQRKNKFLPYLLILPSMLLFSMFTFYPFLKTIALSFFLTDKRGNPTKWAGISNWVRVLSKETFWKVIAITLEIAGINLVFTFGLAIFFALLSSQKKKGGKLYQTMYALPMAIASSPAAAIFLFIFRQKNGVINSLLGGANIGWTTEMQALEDSGHLHDTDVIIVSDHGQMNLSRVIKPNVFFADAGLIQVDENGNLRDWTAFCCSNAMSAMVYLKDPANVQDYAKTYAVLQKMAAEGIYGFTTVYTKDETKAMGLDGDFSFVLETDGYTSFSTDWNRPAVRPFDRNDFRYGHATHGYLPEKGPQPTFMAVGPSFRENVWLDSAAMIDEAPTFAALLGVPLPAADGKVLQKLLR